MTAIAMTPLAHWLETTASADLGPTRYWYEAACPRTQRWLRLPRTVLAEQLAVQLMQRLETQGLTLLEGKMFGLLIAANDQGDRFVLQAFSGSLQGKAEWPGWVPPIPGRERTRLQEELTLLELQEIRTALQDNQQHPIRTELKTAEQVWQNRLDQLKAEQQQRRLQRQQDREQAIAQLTGEALAHRLWEIEQAGADDGFARSRLKQARRQELAALQAQVAELEAEWLRLRRRRRAISQALQTAMHQSATLRSFDGVEQAIASLGRLPTGTGDCCLPKLLHWAGVAGLTPLSIAEFWWGPPLSDRQAGQFYGPCRDRCQPILGHLLAGLPPSLDEPLELPILYEDADLLAIIKPAGLLSVPGTRGLQQASAIQLLRQQFPDLPTYCVVHRLDQATSGILLVARNRPTQVALFEQFRRRQVHKVYEALLEGQPDCTAGTIDLPLRPDWTRRPYQLVDRDRGRPALTHYRCIDRMGDRCRMELEPITGRTHQLRVHMAHPEGLGQPILGDDLYGQSSDRLYLHARSICFQHPSQLDWIQLTTDTPF
ncbi:RluA family pseudouridine synthase [Synechococcus elongatus]|uniref:RluA family pseudouridine synthase n=1 Tax=Synechococcus elongatus TaxID=32046 RepID=UPI000F7F12B8|nr:RluA family pseudouridine synthase [Synechococcus elongatus]